MRHLILELQMQLLYMQLALQAREFFAARWKWDGLKAGFS
jgi:hypothetical protein